MEQAKGAARIEGMGDTEKAFRGYRIPKFHEFAHQEFGQLVNQENSSEELKKDHIFIYGAPRSFLKPTVIVRLPPCWSLSWVMNCYFSASAKYDTTGGAS